MRSIEDIDLADLTAALKDRFAAAAPTGYLLGRTALRDAITAMLSCSELEAEDIVETMIARGFARYDGDPEQAAGADCPWILRA